MLSTYGYVENGLRYRTLQGDDVIASEQALLMEHRFDGSALALLRLHGDLFLAATGWPLSGEIMVTRVHRPSAVALARGTEKPSISLTAVIPGPRGTRSVRS